ncbi:MAG: hypothetical protein JSS30_07335 [Verrucomicrobia bacterium]|nr:hypothetical protein [Verrucomicrobiota bacterium]
MTNISRLSNLDSPNAGADSGAFPLPLEDGKSSSKTSNIDYYANLYQKYLDFNRTGDTGAEINYYLYPQVYIASQCSHYLNSCISSKAIKGTYASAGSLAVAVSRIFSPSFAKKVEDWWVDPIETKTVLAIGRPIERFFKPLAARSASLLPILGTLDRSFIALCRNIYIVSKDLNTILSVPEKIHSLLDQLIEEESQMAQDQPKTLTGRAWVAAKEGIAIIKDSTVHLIKRIYRFVSSYLKKISFIDSSLSRLESSAGQITPYLKALYHHGKLKLVDQAHRLIEKNEAKIRRKTMGIVAETVARKAFSFFVKFSITTAITYGVYKFPDLIPGLNEYENSKELFVLRNVAGLTYWLTSINTIFNGLQKDYKEDFNPEASTFQELRSMITFSNLHKVIKIIKTINVKLAIN